MQESVKTLVVVSKTKRRKKGYIRPDWLICRSDEDDSVAVAQICQNASISLKAGRREQDQMENIGIRTS